MPDAKAAPPEANKGARNSAKGAPARARKVRTYAVRIEGQEAAAAVQAMNPVARRLAEEIRDAGRPLSMAECAAIVSKFSRSKKPEKLVPWHFCRLYRPAGILVEERPG